MNKPIAKRKKTKKVLVRDVPIGGGEPIVIQSMTNTLTTDVSATVKQIRALEDEGCDVVRVSVPDEASVKALPKIIKKISIPLIADIHFKGELAIESMKAGASKIRINPGNLKEKELLEVIKTAKKFKVPIRIGVNSGSLQKEVLRKHKKPTAQALVESALLNVQLFEDQGFKNIVLAVKSGDPMQTIAAYRLLSERTSYPLHIGVTESGTLMRGSVVSSAACGILLSEGIGDTIRISLSSDPVYEVRVARFLLESLDLRKKRARVFSCPTCARTEMDVIGFAQEMEARAAKIEKDITIAVMGCLVNGPGEMKEADFGLCGFKDKIALYAGGKFLRHVARKNAIKELLKEVENRLN